MTIKETIQSAAQSVLTYVHDNMPEGAVFEDTVLPSSANGVKSSGIYNALQTKADTSTVTTLSDTVSTIDSDVSTIKGQITSIQNNLGNKQDALTFDSTPTSGSNNPVTSEGIKTYVDNNVPSIIQGDGISVSVSGTDTTIACDYGAVESSNTTKPVTGAAVKTAIDNATPNIIAGAGISTTTTSSGVTIATNLTASAPLSITNGVGTVKNISASFDTVPTESSTNLLTSGSVKTALDDKQDTLTAGKGIDITGNVISAVLPTSDPGVNNVLWIEA